MQVPSSIGGCDRPFLRRWYIFDNYMFASTPALTHFVSCLQIFAQAAGGTSQDLWGLSIFTWRAVLSSSVIPSLLASGCAALTLKVRRMHPTSRGTPQTLQPARSCRDDRSRRDHECA